MMTLRNCMFLTNSKYISDNKIKYNAVKGALTDDDGAVKTDM